MSMRVATAFASAVFLAGAAGTAHAQGYATQDPGTHAPRNLTLQYLGPSGAGETIPGEPGAGSIPTLRLPSGRGAVTTPPAYGSSTGSASGNASGYWNSPRGDNR